MAGPLPTFNWILWPSHASFASDEFVIVVEGFRVRLMGNSLELVFEGSGDCSPDKAEALAERYLGALRTRLPDKISMRLTTEQFVKVTTPPLGGMQRVAAPSSEDRNRVMKAVRDVRNELLSDAYQTLRRVYDFFQEAREEVTKLDGKPAYPVYKAMEVLKEEFDDSEAKVVKALGAVFKQTKRTANKERHIQKKDQPGAKNSGGSVELARETIRAYERYLLKSS